MGAGEKRREVSLGFEFMWLIHLGALTMRE